MEHPELVQSRLDGERVLSRVDLGGGDAVLVTPTRTLVYRAEGLLSDESVSAYPHDVQRIELRSGRRKTTFRLTYVDGVKDFTVPSGSTHEVLVPVLSAALRASGVIDGDEAVRGAYRFSELTLVVTDRRVVKHVGGAVWDDEFEVAPYADLTGLDFEEGSVATEVSLEVDGYPQRVKVPNEHAGMVRRTVQEAVFQFHDVSSLAELEAAVGTEDEDDAAGEEDGGNVLEESGFTELLGDRDDEDDGENVDADGTDAESAGATDDGGGEGARAADTDPFETGGGEGGSGTVLDPVTSEASDAGRAAGTGDATGRAGASDTVDAAGASDTTGRAGGGSGAAGATGTTEADVPSEVAERLEDLTAAVERQNERLERQGRIIRQLVEELRRGR